MQFNHFLAEPQPKLASAPALAPAPPSDERRWSSGAMISRVGGAKLLAFAPRAVLIAPVTREPRESEGRLQPRVGHLFLYLECVDIRKQYTAFMICKLKEFWHKHTFFNIISPRDKVIIYFSRSFER